MKTVIYWQLAAWVEQNRRFENWSQSYQSLIFFVFRLIKADIEIKHKVEEILQSNVVRNRLIEQGKGNNHMESQSYKWNYNLQVKIGFILYTSLVLWVCVNGSSPWPLFMVLIPYLLTDQIYWRTARFQKKQWDLNIKCEIFTLKCTYTRYQCLTNFDLLSYKLPFIASTPVLPIHWKK